MSTLRFDGTQTLRPNTVTVDASPCHDEGSGGCVLECHDNKTQSYSMSLLYDNEQQCMMCPTLVRLPWQPVGLTPDKSAILLYSSPKKGQFPFCVFSAITGKLLFDAPPRPSIPEDIFPAVQDFSKGDFVLFPRVAVFKMRGRTSGAQGIFVFRWGMALLSDKPAARFVSKIHDSTCCDLYACSPESTTLILCPHDCAYILEFPNLGSSSTLPHWEYPVPHFVSLYGFRDDFLRRWFTACVMAESEVLLQQTLDSPTERNAIVASALQEMPEVPAEIYSPSEFARQAAQRYPSSAVDTKIFVDCQYVYVMEYDARNHKLVFSYGIIGHHVNLCRLDPLECDVFIHKASCCNFGRGDASALFLVPGPQKTRVVYLSSQAQPIVSIVGMALTPPRRMARDHHQGIVTDTYRVTIIQSAPET
jgi:hypothetical protein